MSDLLVGYKDVTHDTSLEWFSITDIDYVEKRVLIPFWEYFAQYVTTQRSAKALQMAEKAPRNSHWQRWWLSQVLEEYINHHYCWLEKNTDRTIFKNVRKFYNWLDRQEEELRKTLKKRFV